jgi:hypothetical protein
VGTELQADQSAVRTGLIRDRYPFFALKRNEARVFRGSVMDYSKTPENLRPKQTYAAMSLAPLIVSRSPMSAPAQNARPLPVRTITRIAGSASARSMHR